MTTGQQTAGQARVSLTRLPKVLLPPRRLKGLERRVLVQFEVLTCHSLKLENVVYGHGYDL